MPARATHRGGRQPRHFEGGTQRNHTADANHPGRCDGGVRRLARGDYRQLPDIVGIHLGMPADEALKNFRKQYEKVQMAPLVRWAGAPEPSLMEFDVGLNVLGLCRG
jgi:hypothetical protein